MILKRGYHFKETVFILLKLLESNLGVFEAELACITLQRNDAQSLSHPIVYLQTSTEQSHCDVSRSGESGSLARSLSTKPLFTFSKFGHHIVYSFALWKNGKISGPNPALVGK